MINADTIKTSVALPAVCRRDRRQKAMLSTEPWPLDEVSTRNCRHCLAPKDGVYVCCRKGHPMVGDYSRHKRQITYNGVITAPRLLKPCRGCADFDNDWS